MKLHFNMQFPFIAEAIKLEIKQSNESSLDGLQLPKTEAQETMFLIICNTGKPNKSEGQPENRRIAITGLLIKEKPDIVLFQEFPWVGIRGLKKLEEFPLHYEYIGHNHASILYDRNEVNVEQMSYRTMINLLDEMKRLQKIPDEFNPIARMSMHEIESIKCGKAHFICVSWHGQHKEKTENRVVTLKNLLNFIAAIGTKKEMSFIIAGDFNLQYEIAKEEIDKHGGIRIHEFTPLPRRAQNNVDYYITSSNITLSKIAPIAWETLKNGKDAEQLFDHDPIGAVLSLQNLTVEGKQPSQQTSQQNTTRELRSNAPKNF